MFHFITHFKMPHRYRAPNTVTAPRDFIRSVNVLFDGGAGGISIAELDWNGNKVLGIRYNIAAREWTDPEKEAGNKISVGMPFSSAHPVWFVLPEALQDVNSDEFKVLKEYYGW